MSARPERSPRRPMRRSGPGMVQRLKSWVVDHPRVLMASLGRLRSAPLSSLMTVAVIGIALALPTGLYVTLQNIERLSGGWGGSAQISVFLNKDVSQARATTLAEALRRHASVGSVQALSRADAMAEFREMSGFGEALDVLQENPLPAVLVVRAAPQANDPETVQALVETLRAMPETDQATLDLQWVKRLYALMKIGQRAVLVIGALLALAVLLVVGNTIRLEIENRRDEIVITKLIGATNAFIRRPFLYGGLWYGLFGGLVGWLLVQLSLGALSGPVQRLAGSYGSGFSLSALDAVSGLALLAGSAALGVAGSWLAVSRHLNSIEPT